MEARKKNKIISLCDYTGNALRPWAEAGYECIAIDVQRKNMRVTKREGGEMINGVLHVWADVRQWWPDTFEDIAGVLAWPPCTHFAVSGCQDWPIKGMQMLIDGLILGGELQENTGSCSSSWSFHHAGEPSG